MEIDRGKLILTETLLRVQFELKLNTHYDKFGSIERFNPFDLYAIKLESVHFPLLTYDAANLLPMCYTQQTDVDLRIHNYIAGQRWRRLKKEKNAQEPKITQQIFENGCHVKLTKQKKQDLKYFIEGQFKTKFLIKIDKDKPGVPASVPLGKYEDEEISIYTKYIFEIQTQKNSNGTVNYVDIIPLGERNLKDIKQGQLITIGMTLYKANISDSTPQDALWRQRKDKLIRVGHIEAAVPVFITIGILFGLVIIVNYILIKTVRTDFIRYRKIDLMERKRAIPQTEEIEDARVDLDDEDEEQGGRQPIQSSPPKRESKRMTGDIRAGGWKLISQDAQQPPQHPFVLVASVGAGIQLLFAFVSIMILGSWGGYFLHQREGTLVEWLIYLYVAGAIPGGFVSGFLYKKLAPSQNKFCLLNLIATTLVIPLPLCVVMISINLLERVSFLGIAYQSTKALPFDQYVKIFFSWILFVIPLTVISGIFGRNLSNNPLIERSRIQRQLPKRTNCLARPTNLLVISGLIQFIPVCVFYGDTLEGIWSGQVFNDYVVILLEFLLLLITVATIGMTTIYLILQSENHQWWKPSFSIGGALSSYLFCLSLLFFLGNIMAPQSDKGGFHLSLRLLVGYLSYNMLIGWAVYIMLGSVGFLSSFTFMRFLYSKVRLD